MLTTLHLTKVIENYYWVGKRKRKLKLSPTTKMTEDDYLKAMEEVKTIKK